MELGRAGEGHRNNPTGLDLAQKTLAADDRLPVLERNIQPADCILPEEDNQRRFAGTEDSRRTAERSSQEEDTTSGHGGVRRQRTMIGSDVLAKMPAPKFSSTVITPYCPLAATTTRSNLYSSSLRVRSQRMPGALSRPGQSRSVSARARGLDAVVPDLRLHMRQR
jgi:hypothetical protein